MSENFQCDEIFSNNILVAGKQAVEKQVLYKV